MEGYNARTQQIFHEKGDTPELNPERTVFLH